MSGPQIMFVCDYCSEHNPEMCGHYDAEDIRLAPNGSWLCESCFDEETPSELGRFSDAPIAYLEAAPSPSPAPGVTFEQWWKASKYRQVIYAGASEQQIARDGWNAALTSLSQAAKGAEGGGL